MRPAHGDGPSLPLGHADIELLHLPLSIPMQDPAEHGIEGERYQHTEMAHPTATS